MGSEMCIRDREARSIKCEFYFGEHEAPGEDIDTIECVRPNEKRKKERGTKLRNNREISSLTEKLNQMRLLKVLFKNYGTLL